MANWARRARSFLDRGVAGEGDAAQVIASSLLQGEGDVDALALLGPEGEQRQAAFVADLGGRLADDGLEVALVLVGHAYALGIFFELAGVVGAGEEILEKDGMRNADGLQVPHGGAQGAAADVLVAGEADVADLDRRAFLDAEVDLHRGRRNGLDVGLDGGELVSVFGQQLLQDDVRARDAVVGSYWLFDGEADLLLLESVENIGGRDGVEPL